MIKNENRGRFIDHQRKGVGVGEKKIDVLYFFLLARSPMFSKRTKRNIKQRLCTGLSVNQSVSLSVSLTLSASQSVGQSVF